MKVGLGNRGVRGNQGVGLVCLRTLLVALLIASHGSCGAKPPTKELADAQAALRAAREAGADSSSPEFQAAESLLNQALADLRERKYDDARSTASEAKRRAEDILAKLMQARPRPGEESPGSDGLQFDPGSVGRQGEILTPGDSYIPDGRLILKRAYFRFDDYSLTDEAASVLRANAVWLNSHPEITVLIEGHCDERGTNEYNLALGERRAERAKEYLLNLGVPSERLRVISYGEEIPLDSGDSEEAYARNRRIQFVRAANPL